MYIFDGHAAFLSWKIVKALPKAMPHRMLCSSGLAGMLAEYEEYIANCNAPPVALLPSGGNTTLDKEPHGYRPLLPPGTLVYIESAVGVVKESCTLIGWCNVPWAGALSPELFFVGPAFPTSRVSHTVRRPQYSVMWLNNTTLPETWFTLNDFARAELPVHLPRGFAPWPKLELIDVTEHTATAIGWAK